MKTIVLLSGGLDSAAVLASLLAEGDECLAVGFDYDQGHVIELDRAESIADHFGVPFERVGLPSMFNAKIDDVVFAGRNMVLASLAIAMAQARGFDRIAVGCNKDDWGPFPDCRPWFWSDLADCAIAYGVQVSTPLIHHTKREVADIARRVGVPIELTWSCYSPRFVPSGDGWDSGGARAAAYEKHPMMPIPCKKCLACTVRQEALCS